MAKRSSGPVAATKSAVMTRLMSLPTPAVRRLAGPPITIEGRTLDPRAQLMLRLMRLAGPPIEDRPISQGRRAMVASTRAVGGNQPVGSVSDRVIPGPGGDLTLRLYAPRGRTGIAPAVMFVHGGGFVYGGLSSHDAVCRFLAEEAQVRVVAVRYRLAPEHPFPAAVEDVRAAWQWVVDNAEAVGIDPDRIGVAGDSAGANLAAVLCQQLVAEGGRVPDHQVLIYPVTDFSTRRRSRDLFGEGFLLTDTFMDQCRDFYLVSGEDETDPRVSPLLGELTDLPPALVVTAGFDPLLDDGEAYAQALREAGVRVEYMCAEEQFHGFANGVGPRTSGLPHMRRVAAAVHRGLS